MRSMPSLFRLGGAGAAMGAALAVLPSAAGAADLVDVDVYRPRAVYVAPASRVYVAPSRVVTVGPRCVVRRARVWVNGHLVYRTVRRCI